MVVATMCVCDCVSLIPGLSRGSDRVKYSVRECPPVSSVIINNNQYDPPGSVRRGGGGGGVLVGTCRTTSPAGQVVLAGPARLES